MNQDQLLQCRDFWSCEHFRRELRRSGELDFMVVTSTNAKERRFTGTSMTNFILEEEPQDDFECLRTIWDNDGDMPRFLLAVKNETVQRVCDNHRSGAKSRDPNPREYNPLDYVQTEHQMIPIYKSALQAYQHRATLDKQTQKAIILRQEEILLMWTPHAPHFRPLYVNLLHELDHRIGMCGCGSSCFELRIETYGLRLRRRRRVERR